VEGRQQLAEAIVWAGLADWQEVVVAVQWAAGVVTQAAAVGWAAVVATLEVAVAVVEAGVHLQLLLNVQKHGSFYMALGTRCHQSAQNFLTVVLSTFHSNCLFSVCFSFFFALVSNCFVH
jgi:hypothetical protein